MPRVGEFEVHEGLQELQLAAETNRDPAEQLVRRGAVQAIAMRIYNLRELGMDVEPDEAAADATLLRLSQDPDPIIRSETAFAMGRIATPTCVARLEVLVDDPYADTRYNAAVALAHLGNAKGVKTLAEMLEPAPLASVEEEPELQLSARLAKRATIVHNALEATLTLAQKNPQADLAPIIDSLRQLASADEQTLAEAMISVGAVSDARRTLELLGKTTTATGEAEAGGVEKSVR